MSVTKSNKRDSKGWLTRLNDDDGTDLGDNVIQELLSEAMLSAIASAAGLQFICGGKDVHGIDGRIDPAGHDWSNGVELRIQLKAKATVAWKTDGSFLYSLEEDKYRKLQRDNRHLPLLVLVDVTSRDCAEWCNTQGQYTVLSAVPFFSIIPFVRYEERAVKGIQLFDTDRLTPQRLRALLKMGNNRSDYESLRKGGRPWDSKSRT